jgi:uncharacterized membrane protein
MFSKISLLLISFLFITAGVNHFINPKVYLKLIPDYFPNPYLLNQISGLAEIILGIALLFSITRNAASWGIILLLIAFIPAHIYMIQQAPIKMGRVVITPLIAWLRLPLQFVLMYWAYSFIQRK